MGTIVHDDVLDDGTEADGAEDLGLLLGGEVRALGVAAALDVEHARLRPHVLVVADERAPRVGGERRLAGAAEAEEERERAVGALVRRRVERQLPRQRHLVPVQSGWGER